VEWFPDLLIWKMDGVTFHVLSPNQCGGHRKDEFFIPDKPFYPIFNLAVGGHLPGFVDHTTVFPQVMQVDWFRSYVWDDTPEEPPIFMPWNPFSFFQG
jgi:beta-glucanase (GH16 family)